MASWSPTPAELYSEETLAADFPEDIIHRTSSKPSPTVFPFPGKFPVSPSNSTLPASPTDMDMSDIEAKVPSLKSLHLNKSAARAKRSLVKFAFNPKRGAKATSAKLHQHADGEECVDCNWLDEGEAKKNRKRARNSHKRPDGTRECDDEESQCVDCDGSDSDTVDISDASSDGDKKKKNTKKNTKKNKKRVMETSEDDSDSEPDKKKRKKLAKSSSIGGGGGGGGGVDARASAFNTLVSLLENRAAKEIMVKPDQEASYNSKPSFGFGRGGGVGAGKFKSAIAVKLANNIKLGDRGSSARTGYYDGHLMLRVAESDIVRKDGNGYKFAMLDHNEVYELVHKQKEILSAVNLTKRKVFPLGKSKGLAVSNGTTVFGARKGDKASKFKVCLTALEFYELTKSLKVIDLVFKTYPNNLRNNHVSLTLLEVAGEMVLSMLEDEYGPVGVAHFQEMRPEFARAIFSVMSQVLNFTFSTSIIAKAKERLIARGVECPFDLFNILYQTLNQTSVLLEFMKSKVESDTVESEHHKVVASDDVSDDFGFVF